MMQGSNCCKKRLSHSDESRLLHLHASASSCATGPTLQLHAPVQRSTAPTAMKTHQYGCHLIHGT
eukprot:scaffold120184_cov17-Tisochrysis_lutea.AAC.1